MDYPLAKELKDAGYRFTLINDGLGHATDCLRMDDTCYQIPTLEELIEACTKNTLGLFFRLAQNSNGWCACLHDTELIIVQFTEDVPTRIEAVARLWLALNKKS